MSRTLRGLHAQTLPSSRWETLLVDNASIPPIDRSDFIDDAPPNLRLVNEESPGLSHARRRGLMEAKGEYIVLVDDDNVLAPDYLTRVVELFAQHLGVGALGGPCRPEFECEPAPWVEEFFPLLALRDFGPNPLISGLRAIGAEKDSYPEYAPVGAGMALRRKAAQSWLEVADPTLLTDRRGGALTSSGDNDIIIRVLRAGWDVAYIPELAVTHLIPASRLSSDYLARLNHGIQKSWMQVLHYHGLSDWPSIPRWTVPLRQAKAWFTYRAWSSPAARIRWQGACGHFSGRAPGNRT